MNTNEREQHRITMSELVNNISSSASPPDGSVDCTGSSCCDSNSSSSDCAASSASCPLGFTSAAPLGEAPLGEAPLGEAASDAAQASAAAQTSAAAQDHSGLHNTARKHFIHYLQQFTDALVDMFPERHDLKLLKVGLDTSITHNFDEDDRIKEEVKMIEKFHAQMQPYYPYIMKQDDTPFTDASMFEKLPPIGKIIGACWPDLDGDGRATCWQYVGFLHQNSVCYNMYKSVPKNFSSTLEKMTSQFATSMSSPNQQQAPNMEHAMKMLNGLDRDDMMSFAQSMMSNPSALQDVMSLGIQQMKNLQAQTQKTQIQAQTQAAVAKSKHD